MSKGHHPSMSSIVHLSLLFVLVSTLFLNCCTPTDGSLFRRNRKQQKQTPAEQSSSSVLTAAGEEDDALYLTSYIEAGNLTQARQLAKVHNLPGINSTLESYSGYITVNKKYNSNLFFWFFPALSNKTNVPVLLWLNGGPGASSLFGLFVENGPLVLKDATSNQLHRRSITWNEEYAVLYVDQPVGTGFSFTDQDEGYAKSEEDVARDMYELLKQFFTLFDSYRGNAFYLTGESYAGKYLPAIGYKIHQQGDEAKKVGINLQGIAIGDGWCDPRNMLQYGEFLYQVGLIDEQQLLHFKAEQSKAIAAIDRKDFNKAFHIIDQLMDGDLTPNGDSYYRNVTGLNFYFNILIDEQPDQWGYHVKFLNQPSIRKLIHVGKHTYLDENNRVEQHLINDSLNSVKPWVEALLDAGYRMIFYSGQLDIIVAAPLTESFLKNVRWRGANKYHDVSRKVYKVTPNDSAVAGYVRVTDNLYQVIIRNAGHMVPYDQPRAAYDMLRRFIEKKDF